MSAGLPPLNPILDVDVAARAGWAPLDLLRVYLDAGASFIQLRAKHMESAALLELSDAAVSLGAGYSAHMIVNDRVDVARLAGAAGVHVGQDDLAPGDVRRLLGTRAVVGFSTHSVEQVDAALREPISYLAVGPIFGSRTKETGYAAVGLDLVSEAAARAGALPVVAIGGITLDRAESVIRAGAAAVAVISDLVATSEPGARVAAYLRALAAYRV